MGVTAVKSEPFFRLLVDGVLDRDELCVWVLLLILACAQSAFHSPSLTMTRDAPRNKWCTASAPTIHLPNATSLVSIKEGQPRGGRIPT